MTPSYKILLLPTFKTKRSYCWNPSWVKKYESPWSILEKFKYANLIYGKDILLEFGTIEVLSKKIIYCNKTNGNLLFLKGFDGDALKTVLGIDVKKNNEEYVRVISELLPKSGPTVLREKFTYCRTCLSYGYHSIFHQCRVIHHCPYHNRKLENQCPKCKFSFDYQLSDELKNPFECKCGYMFLKKSKNFSKCWSRFKPHMVNNTVIRWISLSDEKKEVLKNLIVFNKINYENYPDALEQILSVVEPDNSTLNGKYTHTVTKTSKNIRFYGNRLPEYKKLSSDQKDEPLIKFIIEIEEEIYRSTKGTFHSIAKHIRKTFLQNHKSCLYRAQQGKMRCRYVDAYIHWCKFILNAEHAWKIDNCRRRPCKVRDSFISIQDYEGLLWVVKNWDRDDNRKYESITTTKWIISKFLGLFLINHFYNWIRIASQRDSIKEIMFLPFNYQNLPFALLKAPENKCEELEFHVWMKNEQNKQMVTIRQLKLHCPYDSVKKRRNHFGDFYENNEAALYAAAIIKHLL